MKKAYYNSIEEYRDLASGKVVDSSKEPLPKKKKDPNAVDLVSMLEEKTQSSRRNFLKFFGFSLGSAALAASCDRPVTKAIPYLIKPEEITPGKASYYASTFYDGNEYCPILIKVRDGRPIKIEGNDLSEVTQGGTSAIVQASVLSLYDIAREKSPSKNLKEINWETADKEIMEQLDAVQASGKRMVLLTHPIISPSTKAVIAKFKEKYSKLEVIPYEPVSYSGILKANEQNFGKRAVPEYRFDKASVIVSFGADFLGTWLSPVQFTKQYVKTRKISKDNPVMSQHIQIETGMSLTGSNADIRYPVKPSESKLALANLYNLLAKEYRMERYAVPVTKKVDVEALAAKLIENKGKALIVSGSNDPEVQLIVNSINQMLDSYGNTIDINRPLLSKQAVDHEVVQLVDDMEKGNVGAIMFNHVNPAYDYPEANKLKEALSKVDISISFNSIATETNQVVTYVCPDNHYLESWNDAEIYPGTYSLMQPGIAPIFKTRHMQESLLKWSGSDEIYYVFLKRYWAESILKVDDPFDDYNPKWSKALHDGIYSSGNTSNGNLTYQASDLTEVFKNIEDLPENIELELFQMVGIRNGYHANNPWLQEMPDPVTKSTWDNFASVSPIFAEENGLEQGSIISVEGLEVPVMLQPGQAYNTLSIALGFGRTNAGKVADKLGINAYPLVKIKENRLNYTREKVSFEKIGSGYEFAMVQTHHSMENRPLIRETTLENYIENADSGNEMHDQLQKKHVTLYNQYNFPGHHWGMAIDLNSCTGCSACVVACNAENNIPVVGRQEVQRAHEMHWIRIDRYYAGDIDNPQVVRQPVMCQHCDNAPCENVCPVAATTHSTEGINQMAYNRCIGTRYCNNNCPYKVRRFNWYDYTAADAIPANRVDPAGMTIDLTRMVLNPDVTVRAKGVIEKCSFCIQRIQERKLDAKIENRMLRDGEVKTACQQACPADAIHFGDLNDENSMVSQYFNNERNYHLLEELHTLPSVGYLTKVRNAPSVVYDMLRDQMEPYPSNGHDDGHGHEDEHHG